MLLFLCSRICAAIFAVCAAKAAGLEDFLLVSCATLFFFGLPALLFSASTSPGFQREGEGEGERGREQRGEIGEIGGRRERERGEGQGRDKEGREREVVKGLTSTTGFHSLQTGGLDLTN